MGRSFGLAAYRALSRRTKDKNFAPNARRPKGELVWIHAPEPGSLLAIEDLAQRLCSVRQDLTILITLSNNTAFEQAQNSSAPHKSIVYECVPSEHPEAVKKFWRHWKPDMGIWAWGALRPSLLTTAHDNDCPMLLIDADANGFDGKRDRWLPDFSRQLLDPFAAIMVRSPAALKRMEALGLTTGRIDVTPALEAGGQTLPCEDIDLADLSEQLKGRPVWFASNVQSEEINAVLSAHRQALRLSHRLLLVLHPAHSGLVDEVRAAVSAENFRLVDWTSGETCDDATQVLLSSEHSDIGLFYRVAPVSFMGSSLVHGYGGRNPFEAAALGSAVLYGPNVRRFMPFYTRLANAGAARIVRDEQTLGAAVTQLVAPDRAAAMAHAGWDVISQGADLTDRVIEMTQAGLDGDLERPNART